jgi:hypothetical protein
MIRRSIIGILTLLATASLGAAIPGPDKPWEFVLAETDEAFTLLRVTRGHVVIHNTDMSQLPEAERIQPQYMRELFQVFKKLAKDDAKDYQPDTLFVYRRNTYKGPRICGNEPPIFHNLRMAKVDTVVAFPVWLPIFIFGFLPLMSLLVGPVRARRRRRKGLCTGCAYSLTGNTSGVCPECGRAV